MKLLLGRPTGRGYQLTRESSSLVSRVGEQKRVEEHGDDGGEEKGTRDNTEESHERKETMEVMRASMEERS